MNIGRLQSVTRSCDIFYQNVKICETTVLKAKSLTTLIVRRKPGRNPAAGLLQFGNRVVECRLGRTGIRTLKMEGDGATPPGSFRILFGYMRHDRLRRSRTQIRMRSISKVDGWCDDTHSASYNKPVRLPFGSSHEKMMRDDRLYDVCIVLNYNISPVIRNKGSAIFFHQTSEARQPTQGCVAIEPKTMQRLLPMLSGNTVLTVLS